jgi:hypothetical protein
MSHVIGKWISLTTLLTPMLLAGDLSSYRGFQFGMELSALEKRVEMKISGPRMVHQRPAVMQDIEWRPQGFPDRSAASDPVKDLLLSFYNGRLFRIVANYDRYRTEGMTPEDMVEAISGTYGAAAKPAAEVVFPGLYSEKVKVMARWEDAEYSLNLVRSPYEPSFALVLFSKQLDTLAQAATVEADRLDLQEAPQRQAAMERKQADEASAQQERARLLNKPGFRP